MTPLTTRRRSPKRGFARAFLKSQLGAGVPLPDGGTAFVSVRDADKEAIVRAAQILNRLGFRALMQVVAGVLGGLETGHPGAQRSDDQQADGKNNPENFVLGHLRYSLREIMARPGTPIHRVGSADTQPAVRGRLLGAALWLIFRIPLGPGVGQHFMEAAVGGHLGDALAKLRRHGGTRRFLGERNEHLG